MTKQARQDIVNAAWSRILRSMQVAPGPRRAKRRLAPPKLKAPSEHDEQVKLVQWLRLNKIAHFAVPNGARVSPSQAKKLQAEGMLAGVPDIILIDPVHAADGTRRYVAIELKRKCKDPYKKLSKNQRSVHGTMRDAWWIVLVCGGADHAIETLLGMGFGVRA